MLTLAARESVTHPFSRVWLHFTWGLQGQLCSIRFLLFLSPVCAAQVATFYSRSLLIFLPPWASFSCSSPYFSLQNPQLFPAFLVLKWFEGSFLQLFISLLGEGSIPWHSEALRRRKTKGKRGLLIFPSRTSYTSRSDNAHVSQMVCERFCGSKEKGKPTGSSQQWVQSYSLLIPNILLHYWIRHLSYFF